MADEDELAKLIAEAVDSDDYGGEGPWDEGLTEAERNDAVKFLYMRPNAPNDFRSPQGELTAHDRLKILVGTVQLGLGSDDPDAEEMHRLYDVVEDHQRLLMLARHLHEVIAAETARLEGAGALLNAAKVREELRHSLIRINSEMSRLYLDQI